MSFSVTIVAQCYHVTKCFRIWNRTTENFIRICVVPLVHISVLYVDELWKPKNNIQPIDVKRQKGLLNVSIKVAWVAMINLRPIVPCSNVRDTFILGAGHEQFKIKVVYRIDFLVISFLDYFPSTRSIFLKIWSRTQGPWD